MGSAESSIALHSRPYFFSFSNFYCDTPYHTFVYGRTNLFPNKWIENRPVSGFGGTHRKSSHALESITVTHRRQLEGVKIYPLAEDSNYPDLLFFHCAFRGKIRSSYTGDFSLHLMESEVVLVLPQQACLPITSERRIARARTESRQQRLGLLVDALQHKKTYSPLSPVAARNERIGKQAYAESV